MSRRLFDLALSACAIFCATDPALAAADDCEPVRRMVRNFNEVQQFQIAEDIVNDGFGWPSTLTMIVVNDKRFVHLNNKPWRVQPRLYAAPDKVSNCQRVGSETINGTMTEIYHYDRTYDQGSDHIEMWISANTGLPYKSHFKAIVPNNQAEMRLTYSYGLQKEPI